MSFQAVIFDCDGTLVDSEPIGCGTLVEYGGEFGLTMTSEEAIALFAGWKLADCVTEMERRIGAPLPDDFVTEYRRRLAIALERDLRPIDGAVELLESMTVPVGIGSNGPIEKIELSLRTTNMLRFFGGRLFSAYDVNAWKPDPALFLAAAEAMNVVPSKCAVVEDSRTGVLAGVAAGMTVFALRPDGDAVDFPAEVQVIRHLNELRPIFSAARSKT